MSKASSSSNSEFEHDSDSHGPIHDLHSKLTRFFQLTSNNEPGTAEAKFNNLMAINNTLPTLLEFAEMDVLLKLHPPLKASLLSFERAWKSEMKDVVVNFYSNYHTLWDQDVKGLAGSDRPSIQEFFKTSHHRQVAVTINLCCVMIGSELQPKFTVIFLNSIYDFIRNEARRFKELHQIVHDIWRKDITNPMVNVVAHGGTGFGFGRSHIQGDTVTGGSLFKDTLGNINYQSGNATTASQGGMAVGFQTSSPTTLTTTVPSTQSSIGKVVPVSASPNAPEQSPSNVASSSPTSISHRVLTLGFICTKKHEFENMYMHIRDDDDFPEKLPKNPKLKMMKNLCVSYYDINHRGLRIVLATFGNDQGPVTCAVRVPLLLEEFPMDFILMPGIYGGTKLGRVLIGLESYGLDMGRRVWNKQAKRYIDDHELERYHASTLVPSHFVDAIIAAASSKDGCEVVAGTFISATKVRDDVRDVLQEVAAQLGKVSASQPSQKDPWDGKAGVEMESMPLYSLAQIRKVNALVIKGTSDVGWEAFDDTLVEQTIAQHNIAQMKSVDPSFTPKDEHGEPSDNTPARKKYRNIASQNAAAVAWRCAKMWIEQNAQRV